MILILNYCFFWPSLPGSALIVELGWVRPLPKVSELGADGFSDTVAKADTLSLSTVPLYNKLPYVRAALLFSSWALA